ncbi:MAG: hypothetical protein Q9218_006696 [Villophora microphyllina]
MGLRLAPGVLKEKEAREVEKGQGRHSLRGGKEYRDDDKRTKRGYKARAKEKGAVKHELRDGKEWIDEGGKPPDLCIIPHRECLLTFREDIWSVPKRDGDASPAVSPKTVPREWLDGEGEERPKSDDSDRDGGDDDEGYGGYGGGDAGGDGLGLQLRQYSANTEGWVVEEMEMPNRSCPNNRWTQDRKESGRRVRGERLGVREGLLDEAQEKYPVGLFSEWYSAIRKRVREREDDEMLFMEKGERQREEPGAGAETLRAWEREFSDQEGWWDHLSEVLQSRESLVPSIRGSPGVQWSGDWITLAVKEADNRLGDGSGLPGHGTTGCGERQARATAFVQPRPKTEDVAIGGAAKSVYTEGTCIHLSKRRRLTMKEKDIRNLAALSAMVLGERRG